MEFKELIAGFAAKYGIEGLDGADGVAELDVEGVRVELLDDRVTGCLIACAEIGHPPPDATSAFGAMMLKANFLLRGTEGATLCQLRMDALMAVDDTLGVPFDRDSAYVKKISDDDFKDVYDVVEKNLYATHAELIDLQDVKD